MKQPMRLIVHVPLREKRDFRMGLVGLKHALCVTINGKVCTFDLLPALRPRKGQEHQIVELLAQQLHEGWTLMVWDQEKLLRELGDIVANRLSRHPKSAKDLGPAWERVHNASDDEFVDIKSFENFPDGHYLSLVASRENFDPSRYPPRLRRRLLNGRSKRPASEDFWCVLAPILLAKSEAKLSGESYQRWLRANRPRPPKHDLPAVVD